MNPLPSVETLVYLFTYDQDSGKLYNRITRNSKAIEGAEAGVLGGNGCRQISVESITYLTHRLIWKMLKEQDPVELDHINHNPLDNRIGNLREVTSHGKAA